ncbi:hypothetical protein RQP46_005995 [Phenoliferia psychrophenolica]
MPVLPNAARSASGRFTARPQSTAPRLPSPIPSAPSSTSSISSPNERPALFDSRHLPISPPASDTDTDSRTPTPAAAAAKGGEGGLGRGRSWSTSEKADKGKDRRERSSSEGRGFGGFIRRSLSRSRKGSKGDLDRPAPDDAPPVPDLPPALLQLSFLDDTENVARPPPTPVVIPKAAAVATSSNVTTPLPRAPPRQTPTAPTANRTPAPAAPTAEESDLASLLHLVHAAGDLFTEPSSTPAWSPSDRAGATSGARPAGESSGPRPYFSFLSHLDPGPSSSGAQPRPFAQTAAGSGYSRSGYLVSKPAPTRKKTDPDSDDEYGRGSFESDDDVRKDNWTKRPNSTFRKASGGVFAPVQTGGGPQDGPLSPNSQKKRELGPSAKVLFEGTHRKLANPVKEGAQRPASTATAGRPVAFGMRVVLGRIEVDRKLRRGTTMLEAVEIEHRDRGNKGRKGSMDSQASSNSSASSTPSFSSAKSKSFGVPTKAQLREDPRKRLAPISLRSALDSLFNSGATRFQPTKAPPADSNVWSSSNVSPDSVSTPERPAQLPTREGLDKWLRRPTFAERKLVTVGIEGGVLLDLVRERAKQPPIEFSARIQGLARAGLEDAPRTPTVVNPGGRPSREAQPGAPSAVPRTSNRTLVLSPPSKKPVLPGPLLLAALANGTLSEADIEDPDTEEDLPLAVLKSRSPEVAAAAAAALKAAQEQAHFAKEKAFALEAEIGRLRTNELIRKERQERIDEEREDRARMQEIHRVEEVRENELRRRQADQRRRSRAAGQFGIAADTGTPPPTPPDHGMASSASIRRSVSSQSLSPDRSMRRPISFASLKRSSMPATPPIPPAFQQTPPPPAPWMTAPGMLSVPGPYGYPPGMMMPPPQMGMPSPQMGQMGYYDGSQRGSVYGAPAFSTSAPSLNPYFANSQPLVASPIEYAGHHFPPPPSPSPQPSPRMSQRMSYSPANSPGLGYSPFPSPQFPSGVASPASPPVTPPRAMHRGGSVTGERSSRRRPISESSDAYSSPGIDHATRRPSPPREPPRRGQSVPDPFASVRPMSLRATSNPNLKGERRESKIGGHAFLAAASAKRASLLPPPATTTTSRGIERRVSFVSFN